MNRRIVAMCIGRKGTDELPFVLEYCKKENIERLIVLLYGYYITSENGLRKLLSTVDAKETFPIHFVHLGLHYDMNVRTYNNIKESYPFFEMESQLVLEMDSLKRKIQFHSTESESFRWNEEGYLDLLELAEGSDFYVATAGLFDEDDDDDYYWSEFAWSLSRKKGNSLLYMKEEDIVQFEINDKLEVRRLSLDRVGRIKIREVIK